MKEEKAPELREPQHKNFSIRNIPPKIHHLWKVTAALHDVSMEKLALIAIRDYCKSQITEMQGLLDLDPEPVTALGVDDDIEIEDE